MEHLRIEKISGRGSTVFTEKSFSKADAVLTFAGPKVRGANLESRMHALEIGDGWFLGPSGLADDFVNHSCDPNCAVFFEDQGVVLRALRDIAAGEEINFDYSLVMREDDTTFECCCGASNCRGRIGPFGDLPRPLQAEFYRKHLVPEEIHGTPSEANV